ncbi:MAG: CBS domain-containing protein [Acidobacteria bacterium]|nr:CBS domain-containing protein [Acidobacteriota bacterium]
MRWSWRIATVSGIPVYVHGTFLALIAFFLVSDLTSGRTLWAALGTVVFILAVFGAVVLHEFGHAFAARHYGIRTRDITLLPIGGLARLERIPEIPRQELWVALAGPAVNVVIVVVGVLALVVLGLGVPALSVEALAGSAVGRFLAVNLFLALFNLIPAFPMDGGRALRAVLAERMDYLRATEIAASLGQGLALLFGFLGLFTNPFLLFIALFVWMGASAETSVVSVRLAVAGLPVARAMITDFRVVDAGDPLRHAADLVVAGTQQDFPVVEHGRLVGVLTRDALVRAIRDRGLDAPVGEVMVREFETVDVRDLLEQALTRLNASACPVLPVLDAGRVVGLLTSDNVGEFVMIRGAITSRR